MQRQQRLSDVKPAPGSFLPLPSPMTGKQPASTSFLPVPASFTAPKGSGPKAIIPSAGRATIAKPAKPKTGKTAAKAKAAVDLSTPEARAKAVAGADLSTPSGRALVAKAQRASLASTKTSHVPGSSVKPKTAVPKASPVSFDDYMNRNVGAAVKPAAAPSAKITEQHVQAAYDTAIAAKAAGGKRVYGGDFVKLTDLKDLLPGTEAEKNSALTSLYTSQKVNLVPQSNQQALTTVQRQRSIPVGGENKHLISIPPKRK
jgi:hypothetical protein